MACDFLFARMSLLRSPAEYTEPREKLYCACQTVPIGQEIRISVKVFLEKAGFVNNSKLCLQADTRAAAFSVVQCASQTTRLEAVLRAAKPAEIRPGRAYITLLELVQVGARAHPSRATLPWRRPSQRAPASTDRLPT